MSKKIRTEAVNRLFDAILSLENREECYIFFEDICTVNELLSLSQRFEVAKMLRDQKTYLDIAEKTGASTATISRVNRSLNYQSKNGYDIVFKRLEEKGMLERQFLETDRRTAHLKLTEAGREIAEKARELQEVFFAGLYAGVTEEEFALWGSVTRKVCDNIRNLDKGLTNT